MTKKAKPLRSDGKKTYQQLLDTAGNLFALYGLASTQSKVIAAKANVDVALINYHFGSRQGLYQQALITAHASIIHLEDLESLLKKEPDPQQQLKSMLHIIVTAALTDDSWHLKLLARELLAPSENLQVLMTKEIQPKIQIIKHIVSQITGIKPDDTAVIPTLISVMSPCFVMLVAGNGVPGPLSEMRQQSVEQLTSHLYRFALGGLLAVRSTT